MKKKQKAEPESRRKSSYKGNSRNNSKSGGLTFSEKKRLIQLKHILSGKSIEKEKPTTAQRTITFEKMFRDGICQVSHRYYTKMVEFFDINYELLEVDDQADILAQYSKLINYFDPSVRFELVLFNRQVNEQMLTEQFDIPWQEDDFNDIREEYTEMLKKQAAKGNNGIICTDGGALKLLIEAHKSFPSFAEGAAAVVKATTGQFLDAYVPYVKEALEKGLLTEVDIDKAIRGNIFVALKLGLLDGDNSRNPYLSIGKNSTETPPFMTAEARRLAREVTAKSVVLLKNKKLLPLDAGKLRKIAVIGPYSDKIVQDWYSGTPPYETTILSGIRNAVKEGTEIIHAEDNRMGQAEKAAAAADVAIVCVGNHPYGTRADWKFSPVPSDGREAVDRKSLMLPDEDLVKLVLKANPNTILVLVSSFPYTINWSQEHVPAIVHITHCSQEQGNGLADVLFGKVNPAGRTVQTWVKDITDLPDIMDYDIRNGRTYMYHQGPVLYPFGYGLSYSDFAYEKIESFKQDKKNIRVTVSVKNTSGRDGEEVVQLYASYPESKVERPSKQLRAFRRIPIKAGETRKVTLTVPKEELGYWNEGKQMFVVEPGTVKLLIGASSEDIRLEGKIRL